MRNELSIVLDRLKQEMEIHRDDANAVNMAAYLKNKFPCYGIQSPMRNKIQKKWFREVKKAGIHHWDIALNLWNLEQREYQYIAVDYLNNVPKKDIHKDDHHLLEKLITTKSWWETVDLLATNYVSRYFQKFPEQIRPIISEWRKSDNIWLNRTCLIFQLKYNDAADFELLKDLIREYQQYGEFFIQKAIVWSLRQYSKFNPEAVKEFIADIQLKGLAKREASKYL